MGIIVGRNIQSTTADSADAINHQEEKHGIQVVATDANGDEIGRTPVFSDVMLDYCVPG